MATTDPLDLNYPPVEYNVDLTSPDVHGAPYDTRVRNIYGSSKFLGNVNYHSSPIVTGDSPYTILETDLMVHADTGGGDITVDLPALLPDDSKNQVLIINKTSAANTLTIDANGADTVDGAATMVVTAESSITLVPNEDNSNWVVAANVIAGGGGGTGNTASYSLFSRRVDANSLTYSDAAYFNFKNATYGVGGSAAEFTNARVVFEVEIPGTRTLEYQIFNDTTSTLLSAADIAVGASSFVESAPFTIPVADARIVFQVRRTAGAGPNPRIFSAHFEFDEA